MSGDSDDRSNQLDGQAWVCQIIAFALIAGVTIFFGIAVLIRFNSGKGWIAAEPWDLAPVRAILSLLSVVMAAIMAVLSFVVPKAITTAMRRQIAKGQFPKNEEGVPLAIDTAGAFRVAYLNQMIVGMAMLEGAAFFCGISFLLEGRLPPPIAAGVLILLMLARFPTRGSIEGFVEDQGAKLLEDRQSA